VTDAERLDAIRRQHNYEVGCHPRDERCFLLAQLDAALLEQGRLRKALLALGDAALAGGPDA